MPCKDPQRRRQVFNDWYRRNKERIAAKKRATRLGNIERYKGYDARAKERRRRMLSEYKLERGCAIRGYRDHPDALHFDHLPGTDKKNNVSLMYRNKWSEVLKEIAKCQVLCANCHAIETAKRGYVGSGRRKGRKSRDEREQGRAEQQLRLFAA